LRFGGEADDGGGATREIAMAHHDLSSIGRHFLDRVSPLARSLDSGLDRLGTGIHGQRTGQTRDFAKPS
jgi:hypothetical protein